MVWTLILKRSVLWDIAIDWRSKDSQIGQGEAKVGEDDEANQKPIEKNIVFTAESFYEALLQNICEVEKLSSPGQSYTEV